MLRTFLAVATLPTTLQSSITSWTWSTTCPSHQTVMPSGECMHSPSTRSGPHVVQRARLALSRISRSELHSPCAFLAGSNLTRRVLAQVVLGFPQRYSHCGSRSAGTPVRHVLPAVAWWNGRLGFVLDHLPVHAVAVGANARDGWQAFQQIPRAGSIRIW